MPNNNPRVNAHILIALCMLFDGGSVHRPNHTIDNRGKSRYDLQKGTSLC